MKNLFLTSLLTLVIALTGCAKDDVDGLEQGEGIITVSLVGTPGTKAYDPNEGSKVNDFYVYVFNSRGIFEKGAYGDPATLKAIITNLSTATTKKVVALTNLGAEANYPKVTNDSGLADVAHKIDLDEQQGTSLTTGGYIMSGSEDNVALVKDQTKQVTITVKRIVAKVELAKITIDAADGHDADLLKITGVSVQRVSPEVTLFPITPLYKTGIGGFHYGGFLSADTEMIQKDYLAEELTYTSISDGDVLTPEKTFIVFPNQFDDRCTLLTIRATYDGELLYYPIKVNHSTGDLVESNKYYTINVTLKKFGEGTIDPEIPSELANLEVTINVEEWANVIQNEEW